MRQRWIATDSGIIPAEEYVRPRRPRSHLAAPQVIGDTMPAVQSMLDGKMYDSKSGLRSTYRAAGVTEVGNDIPAARPTVMRPEPREIRAAFERALSKMGEGA